MPRRTIAKRRTPKAAFDYTDGAAEGELSLDRARRAFEDVEFHPDILRPAANVDTSCEILGGPSALPFEIEGQHLVLIDDVLMSGRTIRAAMNELFDYGRPASVTLVCLLDLDAGELPISPDVVGATLSLAPQQRVKLSGPTPLELELQDLAL